MSKSKTGVPKIDQVTDNQLRMEILTLEAHTARSISQEVIYSALKELLRRREYDENLDDLDDFTE